ncbi:MAG: hypothetical protein KC505_01825 [Myxococcales bacterium]|nr:hypothetical protein [Myxococcales bacterium]USN50070.1 MAG: hypothetical protein H6731_07295 [Myxococcales bacterium]
MRKNNYEIIWIFLCLFVSIFLIDCGPGTGTNAGVSNSDRQRKLSSSESQEFLRNLGEFQNLYEKESLVIGSWVNNSRKILGIPDPSGKDSYYEKLAQPVVQVGENIAQAGNYVGLGAKILGYIGVPGMSLVSDMASMTSSLKTGTSVIKFAQPSNLREQTSNVYKFALSLKKKWWGLNQSEKDSALADLEAINGELAQGQKVSQSIDKMAKNLERLYKNHNNSLSQASLLYPYAKFYALELGTNMELTYGTLEALNAMGEIFSKSLDSYKSDKKIEAAISNFEKESEILIDIQNLKKSVIAISQQIKQPR